MSRIEENDESFLSKSGFGMRRFRVLVGVVKIFLVKVYFYFIKILFY